MIGDRRFIEEFGTFDERDLYVLRGDDGFEMDADVFVESAETFVEIAVIVEREIARVRFDGEGAEGSA